MGKLLKVSAAALVASAALISYDIFDGYRRYKKFHSAVEAPTAEAVLSPDMSFPEYYADVWFDRIFGAEPFREQKEYQRRRRVMSSGILRDLDTDSLARVYEDDSDPIIRENALRMLARRGDARAAKYAMDAIQSGDDDEISAGINAVEYIRDPSMERPLLDIDHRSNHGRLRDSMLMLVGGERTLLHFLERGDLMLISRFVDNSHASRRNSSLLHKYRNRIADLLYPKIIEPCGTDISRLIQYSRAFYILRRDRAVRLRVGWCDEWRNTNRRQLFEESLHGDWW